MGHPRTFCEEGEVGDDIIGLLEIIDVKIDNDDGDDTEWSPLDKITIVTVKQSLIGKILNFGTIIVDTAGSGVAIDFKWYYVKDPIHIKNYIEGRVHKRQR